MRAARLKGEKRVVERAGVIWEIRIESLYHYQHDAFKLYIFPLACSEPSRYATNLFTHQK